mmetsp:Transcript_23036/g.30626  ORF Transcript_23036/g.30626 Transcript_23036/m.30626 type:complete len:216 (+) Transcript_23036:217-864(+)|eukprot:CAMPEP_0185582800 /NCGR_PEP_ID=MMETSP0434-20130131/21135_1 /TAXON_ID=626734 ORGANISM="Favella taraikaensis, Strain Fe Narragansett Bay" /NCGR_SAMPLE_ID=MMETSP0434 /ASSEMBLY_ACC=CAM_ASM_000379 /LENGTH=215 /DNA_ID=CAMNT_0028201729 /DNA_START=184 /DNA_END=831 /DNA_ORIENTATION=-
MAPIIFFMLKLKERPRAFYYIVLLTAFLFVMNVGKLFYHQARPYWLSPNVHAYSCSTQYGNPSGHSLFGMGATLTIWLDLNQTVLSGGISASSIWAKCYIRAVLFASAVTFGLLVGYSRIILGAHAWNQLALGWQLGVWLALTLHFIFRESILRNVKGLLEVRDTNYRRVLSLWLVIMLATLVAMVANALATEPRIVDDPSWAEAIATKCGPEKA